MSLVNLSRRNFVQGAGALVIGFHLPGCASLPIPLDDTLNLGKAMVEGSDVDVTAWIRISPNNVVTLQVGASEMGQGVYTSLPMILAEELDADWERVRAESAPTHAAYRRQNAVLPGKVQMTGGSESIRGYYNLLRTAGAAARQMLVEAAAIQWGVEVEACSARRSVVSHGSQSMTYGELAAFAATLPLPSKPTLKNPKDFTLLGKSPPRLDLPPKVDGSALFGIDIEQEGMLVATGRNCPHFGGRLVSFDSQVAKTMPGVVKILRIEDAVFVVADRYWRALKALKTIEFTWEEAEDKKLNSKELRWRYAKAMNEEPGRRIEKKGAVQPSSISAVYEVPYMEHAPLEPLNCTAHVQADRCDLWVGTQNPQSTQASVARITGLDKSQVFLHNTFLGGGFGRRLETDYSDWAVKVAQHFDVPVKVLWSREECFAQGAYRPAMLCRLGAAWDDKGRISDWDVKVVGQNIADRVVPEPISSTRLGTFPMHDGLTDHPYDFGREALHLVKLKTPIPTGWLRSVHGTHNAFFRECFLDEVAVAAGRDPVLMRLELLEEEPRQAAVLQRAWKEAPRLPEGQARGVALFMSFGSICAQVVDVSVKDGELTIHRVTAAVDCGQTIHPDTIRAQIMGAVGMGLSSALGEEITLTKGAVDQQNFHQYPLLKMAQMPPVDVHIIDSEERPGGLGEPGMPPVIPALCNAIFFATGKRIRRLPIGDQLKN